MAEYISYLNGEWLPTDDCKIDVFDRGLLMGDAVFDVARTYNGKPFKMERHFARMARSLKHTRMDIGMTPEEFGKIVLEAVDRNQGNVGEAGDLIIWWFATRGKGAWAWSAGPGAVGCRIAPVDFARFSPFFSTGVHGVITKVRSHAPGTVEPKVKHYTRMNFAMAELEANDVVPGGWPVLTDQEGNLTEGTINNVFLVTDGTIRTATDKSILQGISRSVVFDLAKQLGIPIVEEDLQPYDLYTADEAFVSFTGPGVLPMTGADHRQIGDGEVGPVVNQLIAAWSELVGIDIVDQAQRFGSRPCP
jgi:branched-subunit amino acid aminotransferase/4-amino-4-deoxychorismate lyase